MEAFSVVQNVKRAREGTKNLLYLKNKEANVNTCDEDFPINAESIS